MAVKLVEPKNSKTPIIISILMPQKSLSRPPKIRPRKYFENEIFRTFEECMSYSKAFKLKSPNGKVLCWPFLSYLEIFTKILP